MSVKICEGCLEPLSNFDIIFKYSICLECVKTRHYTATKYQHRCHCGKKKRESEEKRMASRRWISCERCLGCVRQIS